MGLILPDGYNDPRLIGNNKPDNATNPTIKLLVEKFAATADKPSDLAKCDWTKAEIIDPFSIVKLMGVPVDPENDHHTALKVQNIKPIDILYDRDCKNMRGVQVFGVVNQGQPELVNQVCVEILKNFLMGMVKEQTPDEKEAPFWTFGSNYVIGDIAVYREVGPKMVNNVYQTVETLVFAIPFSAERTNLDGTTPFVIQSEEDGADTPCEAPDGSLNNPAGATQSSDNEPVNAATPPVEDTEP